MEQKEINIKLFSENIFFSGEYLEQCINYTNNISVIINKNNDLKLNYKMINFENNDLIKYDNYDFSERFLNLKVIISLLEFFDLKKFSTYEIYNFFNNNKEKYNIWKYLYNIEYIHYKTPSNYKINFILRICLSYSWEECLYDLLKRCLNVNNASYKIFIWIDIFCVNQFNNDIKLKGLDKIDNVYYIADIYNISSLKAFERYWCCYEMSLKKKAIDGIFLDINGSYKINKYSVKLKELFDNVFYNNILLYKDKENSNIYKYISEFQKIKDFEENKFSLEKAKITIDTDKIFIEERIKKRYRTIEEYEKRMNIYIYLIKYRDDMKYVYLANRIMEIE